MTTTTSSTGTDRYIGTNIDGERVFVKIETRRNGPTFTTTGDKHIYQTVDHRFIEEYTEVSVTGATKSDRGWASSRQIIDELDRLDPDTLIISPEELDQLRQVWRTCHLNGLQAGCIHQDTINNNTPYEEWKQEQAEQTARCPDGYVYGSRWLVRDLTEEELKTVYKLAYRLADLPRW